jgi:MFS family permease
VLQAGLVLNAFGNGAVGPFVLIYLHNVRGIPVGLAGIASSIGAASGLVAALAAGTIGDRFGLRATLLGGLALSTLAFCLYPLVHETWQAWSIALLTGAGFGSWFSMQSSLLAAITPPDRRHTAFAHQRVAANVGLGLGGLIGGLVAGSAGGSAFTVLFLLNAASFVAYALFVLRVPEARREAAAGTSSSYRDVLRDRTCMRLTALNLVTVAAAIALLNGILPLFAKDEAGVAEEAIGIFFLVNSLLIIGAQLPVARAIQGHRRMRGLAAMALLFAASWGIVGLAGRSLSGTDAALLILGAIVLFSFGECLYSAIQGPLVADLAPEGRLGRYMAMSAFSWQLGLIVGPGSAGLILDAEPGLLWPLAGSLCLVVALAALRLEPRLPAEVRVTRG